MPGKMDAAAIPTEPELTLDSPTLRATRGQSSFEPQILRAPPKVRLAGLARESAARCAIQPRVTHFHYQGDGPFISRELLALLTLSYATRLFTLERIYEALREEIVFQGLLSTSLPHPSTARAFRRLERPSLVSSMECFFELFTGLLAREPGDPDQMRAWMGAVGLKSDAPLRSPLEVERMVVDRVNQATWTDKMLLDF
ncbi:MAG: hypothetical protein HYR88_09780 [Verrucomicrobia bacterium]|nr:hypothetical protein [Verrucomicrobiota bacterium]MBI3867524.1 hypothetical protein [Verrucomicrobiota bacterium]